MLCESFHMKCVAWRCRLCCTATVCTTSNVHCPSVQTSYSLPVEYVQPLWLLQPLGPLRLPSDSSVTLANAACRHASEPTAGGQHPGVAGWHVVLTIVQRLTNAAAVVGCCDRVGTQLVLTWRLVRTQLWQVLQGGRSAGCPCQGCGGKTTPWAPVRLH